MLRTMMILKINGTMEPIEKFMGGFYSLRNQWGGVPYKKGKNEESLLKEII